MSYSDRWTDAELEKLERRIRDVYGTALKDMGATIDQFYNGTTYTDENGNTVRGKSLADKAAAYRKLVEKGERTEDEYKQWLLNQAARGERYNAMRDKLAHRLTEANETAIAYVNDTTPGVYTMNRNYEAYTIEQSTGSSDFILFDEATVRRLIVEEPKTMPYYPPRKAINRGIDLAFGQSQITKHVTSGILQGASIPNIARNLRESITNMGYVSSVRAARTAVTAAQNGGRMETYREAEQMGIQLEREWMATLDNRTRHAHQILDGQKAKIGDKFHVDGHEIEYPGDPSAPGYLVYNCRCTLKAVIPGHGNGKLTYTDPNTGERHELQRQTYEEWAESKKDEMFKTYGDNESTEVDLLRNSVYNITNPNVTETERNYFVSALENMDDSEAQKYVRLIESANITHDSNRKTGFDPQKNTINIRPGEANNDYTYMHELVHMWDVNTPVTSASGKKYDSVRDLVSAEYSQQMRAKDYKTVYSFFGCEIPDITLVGTSEDANAFNTRKDILAKWAMERTDIPDIDLSMIFDIVSGITNDDIGASSIAGHTRDYWLKNENRVVIEAIPSVINLQSKNRTETIGILKKIVPELSRIIEKETGSLW